MTQDKIKKGDLIKANRDMWGSYLSHYGHVNFEIKKNIMFLVLSDQTFIPEASIIEVNGLIDNKIVTIIVKDKEQLSVV
jgi:hypothetical protein